MVGIMANAIKNSAFVTEEVESEVCLPSSITPCLSKSIGVLEPICIFCN